MDFAPLKDFMDRLTSWRIPGNGIKVCLDGKEVFTFKTKEELSELVPRILKDTELAKKVGEAGRKRCLAEHTHFHRVKQILEILE